MWKRKVSIKEQYGSLRHFLKGDEECHYLGQRYMENTNVLARREWRGVKDTSVAFAYWLKTWLRMASLPLRNPVRIMKAFWKYRWLSSYLIAPAMVDRWVEGDRGMVLSTDLYVADCLIADSVDIIWKQLRADKRFGENKWYDKTIAFDYTLPKHIMFGFPGYIAINIQQHSGFMQPMLRRPMGAYYIDQAVSCGIPGDMCTLPLVETGVAVEGEYPDIGNFFLSSNNPCDANIMDNNAMYRQLSDNGRKPCYALTSPLLYDDPTTKELAVHELEDGIRFLEQQTGMKFNWDTFIDHIEKTNQITREELERWDINANSGYGCMNPLMLGLFRIYFYQHGGTPYFVKGSKKMLKAFYKCAEKKINQFPKTRHRAVGWSCENTYYSSCVVWLYHCWGILTLQNMDSVTGHNIIDTEDREQLMEDLADAYARTPMRTHTVGGNRHLLQMWETAEKFNCDMIVMYDDIGCKGMAGAMGLMEDEFTKHRDQFHIMWMPHSLMDYRIVPPAETRRAVNQYMTSVMHEEPLDPTLLDFDDSDGW